MSLFLKGKSTNFKKYKENVRKLLQINKCQSVNNLIKILQKAKVNSTIKTHRRVRNNSLWMTKELLHMIRKRNNLFNKLKKQPNNIDIEASFKNAKNKVKYEITKAKQNYFNDKLQLAGGDQ